MEQYIGIPYRKNGRDRSGLDCYGLVWIVEKEVYNKSIPKLLELSEKTATTLIMENTPLINAVQVTKPINGDIVLFFYHDLPVHVGVFDNNHVLHSVQGVGVVYEKITANRLRKFNKEEYYRV